MSTWHGGSFTGLPLLRWKGPRSYELTLETPRFAFTRPSGNTITPGPMTTDGGTIPRLVWIFSDLDPWTYMPAYIIHDWCCLQHHQGHDVLSFEDTNSALAEGITTLIDEGLAGGEGIDIDLIYTAVSSPVGRYAWDHGFRKDG